MEEQNKPAEEPKPDFLEQVKAERVILEKVRDENKKLLEELQKIKAVEILSGRADQPQQQKQPELSNKEYADAALSGKFNQPVKK